MRHLKLPALLAIAAILAVVLIVVWWPRTEAVPGPPLSVEQIRTCSDSELIDLVSSRLSLRAGQAASGWRRLPEAARLVYVARSFTMSCSRYCLADQAVASLAFPDAPNPSETSAAFHTLNLEEIAKVLDIMRERMKSPESALGPWIAYRNAGEGASSVPPNPFADLDGRLHTAMKVANCDAILRAFIRAKANEIADP